MSLLDRALHDDHYVVGYSPHLQSWLTLLMREVVGSASNLKFRWITSPEELIALLGEVGAISVVFHGDDPIEIATLGEVQIHPSSFSHLQLLIPQNQGLQFKSLLRTQAHQPDIAVSLPSLKPSKGVKGGPTAPVTSDALRDSQSQTGSQGVVIATLGTPGSGATELALALSGRLGTAAPTVLLDTTFDGALPFRMGLAGNQPTISELARSFLRREPPYRSADSYCQGLPQGDFDVLLGLASPRHSALVDYQLGTAILGDLQRHYRFVVADVSTELLVTPFGDLDEVRERLSLCTLAQERSSYTIFTTRASSLSLFGFATALEAWGKLAPKATSFTIAVLDTPSASSARKALRAELSAILALCHDGVGQVDEFIEIPKDAMENNRLDPSAIPSQLVEHLRSLGPAIPASSAEPIGRPVKTKSPSLGELYDYFDALPYS